MRRTGLWVLTFALLIVGPILAFRYFGNLSEKSELDRIRGQIRQIDKPAPGITPRVQRFIIGDDVRRYRYPKWFPTASDLPKKIEEDASYEVLTDGKWIWEIKDGDEFIVSYDDIHSAVVSRRRMPGWLGVIIFGAGIVLTVGLARAQIIEDAGSGRMNERAPFMQRTNTAFYIWCGSTVLLSAFLLFQVQPIISKSILPWFGGSPAVWSTCMLFFQLVLLAGYAYAHFIRKLPTRKAQMLTHCVLLLVGAILLPIIPGNTWKPVDSANPTGRILMLLMAHVGLPYFMLSSTGPLTQAWFANRIPGRSPYRLYALSNVGSLLALLTYPFIVEPMMTVNTQGFTWSIAFAGFGILSGLLAFSDWKTDDGASAETDETETKSNIGSTGDKPTVQDYLLWISLAALASVLLLAITNHVCQDVAVVPFLWVAPLSLYLITFIICFDNESWYVRPLFALLAFAGTLFMALISFDYQVEEWISKVPTQKHYVVGGVMGSYAQSDAKMPEFDDDFITRYTDDIIVQVFAYLGSLFVLCMMCHGELVRSKPKPQYLTTFYLSVSAGGALGGGVVSLVAPYLFNTYIELQISIGVACAASVVVMFLAFRHWALQIAWCLIGITGFTFVVVAEKDSVFTANLTSQRNFYGVLRVKERIDEIDPDRSRRSLYHGRILHGTQFLSGQYHMQPTTYYVRDSGVGVAVGTMRKVRDKGPIRLGVIGLGTGTMATYGELGDTIHFYEINPLVERIARKHFTYLTETPATVEIAPGDARISMEREEPQEFDVLVIDAFSGDAIPTHLVTDEAIKLYKKHIREDGIIAVHISNIYLDLYPIVHKVASSNGLVPVRVEYDEQDSDLEASSDWLLLLNKGTDTLSEEDLAHYLEQTYEPPRTVRMWTDQYSNLAQILNVSEESIKTRNKAIFWAISIAMGMVFCVAAAQLLKIPERAALAEMERRRQRGGQRKQ